MQMVIDEPNICNQTGRVYFCINGNESSVCHVRLYNTPHSDDGIIALFEEKTTLYLGSDGLVNRLYVIRRYFSKRLVFHSRKSTARQAAALAQEKEVRIMKGYYTANGYMGYANGTYILFASEDDYREWLLED